MADADNKVYNPTMGPANKGNRISNSGLFLVYLKVSTEVWPFNSVEPVFMQVAVRVDLAQF